MRTTSQAPHTSKRGEGAAARQSERLWNRNYWRVMTANFSLFFAFYLLTPLLPLYLSETFHATKDTIGLVLSGYTLTALFMRPFSGFMVDSFPRKRVLMVCFVLFAAFFASYLLASSLLAFALFRTLHGGPFGAVTVANSTVAIDVLPSSRRNEGIGYYGLSNNLAMAVAPTVGIALYHLSGSFSLLFWVALAVAVLGLLADSGVTLETVPSTTPAPAGKRPVSLDRFFLLKGWRLALDTTAFGFCFGVLSNYLAIYGKQQLGITSGTGTWFLLCAAGLILSRLQGAKALRQGRLTHNAAEGMVISLVGYTLFVACPNMAGYYGSAVLIGLGNGHLWPAFQNMIIGIARHDQRGTANSTILISWDVGMGLGVLLGGVVAEHLGYLWAFWMVTFVNALGVTFYFLKIHRTMSA